MALLGQDRDEIWLLDAPSGEGWDISLAVFDTNADKWFLVLLDVKARVESTADELAIVLKAKDTTQFFGHIGTCLSQTLPFEEQERKQEESNM